MNQPEARDMDWSDLDRVGLLLVTSPTRSNIEHRRNMEWEGPPGKCRQG